MNIDKCQFVFLFNLKLLGTELDRTSDQHKEMSKVLNMCSEGEQTCGIYEPGRPGDMISLLARSNFGDCPHGEENTIARFEFVWCDSSPNKLVKYCNRVYSMRSEEVSSLPEVTLITDSPAIAMRIRQQDPSINVVVVTSYVPQDERHGYRLLEIAGVTLCEDLLDSIFAPWWFQKAA